MFRGGDEIQRVVPDGHRLDQWVRLGRQGDDGNFCASMEDLVVGSFRIQELYIQCYLRVLAGEGP
ncbi:hypothetical protein D3C77_583960 [compost metagenome]